MESLEALPRLQAVSRQYFHCFGLGLGLALTVLVLCLDTKTVQDTVEKRQQLYRLTRNPAVKVLDNDQT